MNGSRENWGASYHCTLFTDTQGSQQKYPYLPLSELTLEGMYEIILKLCYLMVFNKTIGNMY